MTLKVLSSATTALAIAATAFVIRLYALVWVTPIDFRWESYHYWQIAYYTLKIGISHGRMWDLGGLEYFWGPLPTLVQSFLLWSLGTSSIFPFRLLTAALGAVSCYLAFLIGKHYFDDAVGVIAAAVAAVNPILLFNSTIGMQETMGTFFVLAALAAKRKSSIAMGLLLALASLSRIEFWLLSAGIIGLIAIFERKSSPVVMGTLGWLTLMVPYFIHVRGTTGNPFYAFYWNFIGNIAGAWKPWYVAPETQTAFTVVLVATAVGILALYRFARKAKSYLIYGVFFGFAAYHGLVYTLGGSAPLFERFFVLDAALGSVILARLASRTHFARVLRAIVVVSVAASAFIAAPYYISLQSDIRGLWQVADELGSRYNAGTVLNNMPMITYRLVDHWRIPHTRILGTLYMPLDDPKLAIEWMLQNEATWIIVAEPKSQAVLAFFNGSPTYNGIFKQTYAFSGAFVYAIDLAALKGLVV